MTSKRRNAPRKAKKAGKKGKRAEPVRIGQARRRTETKKLAVPYRQAVQEPPSVETPVRERYVITVENIRGETAIGDLLVTFPRTREVLVGKGLRLEAEDAGDIYMTLDAFSAMNGLRTETLVQELVEVAKQPLSQPSPAQLVASPVA